MLLHLFTISNENPLQSAADLFIETDTDTDTDNSLSLSPQMRAADTDTDSSATAADTSGMSVSMSVCLCAHTWHIHESDLFTLAKGMQNSSPKEKTIQKNLNYFSIAKPELFRVA